MKIGTFATNPAGSAAKAAAQVLSPTIHRIRLQSALRSLETYCAFLGGKGAGSGWDHNAEIQTVATTIGAENPVVFDIGANNGAWARSLARVLAPRSPRLYLFECSPHCLAVLRERVHELPNARLFDGAVSSVCGEATLFCPDGGSGLASLHERHDRCVVARSYEETTVATVTIDSIVEQEGIQTIDLLKMDIEGHELEALRGAARTLERGGISALTFEFGSGNVNSRTFFRDFWELLTGYGYRVARIIPGGGTLAVERYTEDLEYFRGATNYVATLHRK